jgi:soluble lytic murein transglycosylase-like protein
VVLAGGLAAVLVTVLSGPETIAPFAYQRSRETDFERAGAAGESHLVYARSPGGAVATARRVAGLRAEVVSAARTGGVAPDLVEAMVYLESGGQPAVIAGGHLSGAVGVAQILPETARDLLGLHVDLAASRRLTRQIAAARRRGDRAAAARLARRRARVDQRFDPARSLAAMGRYLAFARPRFGGRTDFAAVSYHMGVGNLADVVRAYAGPKEKRLARRVIAERRLTYAQLYFDSGPFRHRTSYRRLQALGDDSSTYYWRVLAARDVMALYRSNPAQLRRLAALETSYGSAEPIMRPAASTPTFPDQAAVRQARSSGALEAVPDDPGKRHFALDPAAAALARSYGRDPALYASLRPEALAVLYYIADRVHRLSHLQAPLQIGATVRDVAFQAQLARRRLAPPGYSATTTGYSFDVERRYAAPAQALAFQSMLDRLQALDVIAWERRPTVIHITVSSRAHGLLPLLHGAHIGDAS